MGISRRMAVAVSGLAFAGTAVTMLGTGEAASAQTATVTPQHAVTGYSVVDKHRRWIVYDYYWSGCGCCCCC
jgi:hypothetical protein